MGHKNMKRIALLTGGGDCPGLNAVIRSIVKTINLNSDREIIGVEDGFGGLIEGRMRKLNGNDVVGLLPRGGTILGTTNRDNPFRYPVVVNGEKCMQDVSARVLDNLHQWGIDVLIVIGGDGSLRIANELASLGVKVVGVPKTIDNDLMATDMTFGFDTAVCTATEAIDKLHTTAESHHRIMVLEVMGRYAGWIALHAGLAGGADVILIPEIPFRYEAIAQKIRARTMQGKRFSIIVVAEGAKPDGGQLIIQQMISDRTDPVRLGGIGAIVGMHMEEYTTMETRVTVLGHLQRGGGPTAFDRILATRLGVKAAQCALQGDVRSMVSLQGTHIVSVPLAQAVKDIRTVPYDDGLLLAARALGINFGDTDHL